VDDPRPFVLLVGGIGSGKSYAGAVRAMQRRFGAGAPSLGLVVSPTYPMLRDATWRTALDVWAPLVSRVVASEMRVLLKTGDEVIFRSSDDPDRLRGPNASWAWIDEAALCHPETWPITIGRLRQHGALGECWATTTPKGMNWVYDVWVTQANADTAVHRCSTRSNPFVDAAFVDALSRQYDGDFARQELEAEWVADQAGTLIEWRHLEAARTRPAAYLPQAGPVTRASTSRGRARTRASWWSAGTGHPRPRLLVGGRSQGRRARRLADLATPRAGLGRGRHGGARALLRPPPRGRGHRGARRQRRGAPRRTSRRSSTPTSRPSCTGPCASGSWTATSRG
jgi:hypothetical protein